MHKGRAWALAASGLLLFDAFLMVGAFLVILQKSGFEGESLRYLFNMTPLPLVVYAIWALGTFGTVAAIIAIGLYDFKTRWFWRCLVLAAFLWLVFPPIHMLVGLVSLIILFRSRRFFTQEMAT